MSDYIKTSPTALAAIMNEHPNLSYVGWRTFRQSEAEFSAARADLARAWPEVSLCLRVFCDSRFRREYRGRRTSYGLKHTVERWNFDKPRIDTGRPAYNAYVAQGSAAVAALILGFDVQQCAPNGSNSFIVVPSGGSPASDKSHTEESTRDPVFPATLTRQPRTQEPRFAGMPAPNPTYP